jgi:hypothetical protein
MKMLGILSIVRNNRSQFAINRIRFRFRDNMKELGARRIHHHLKEARHELKFLKRVNLGDVKAVDKILRLAYGRIGKRKHQLLAVYTFPSNLIVSLTITNPLYRKSP